MGHVSAVAHNHAMNSMESSILLRLREFWLRDLLKEIVALLLVCHLGT